MEESTISSTTLKRKISLVGDVGEEPFLKEEKLKMNLQSREATAADSDEADKMLQNTTQMDEREDVLDGTKSEKKVKSKKLFYLKVFIAQWVFLLASAIFGYFFVGEAVQAMVNKELIVAPDADFFYLWEAPPIEPEMRIYLFNVTNSAEWMSGKDRKIRVQQIGPYIYKETWTKTNITFHSENSTVSYRMLKKFQFLPEKSWNENDIIIVPNIPLFSAAASMKNANFWTLMGFKAFLNMMDESSKQAFLTKTVKEILWGYDNQLSSMASLVLPEEIGTPGKFGLLTGKNVTLTPWQTVNTGQKSMKHISETLAYNGKTKYDAWGSEECNRIKGSDGSYFHPWLHPSDVLSIFVPDICSAIRLSSTGEEFFYKEGQIKTIRFKPHPNTFNYDLEENKCYCSSATTGQVKEVKEEKESDDESWFDWLPKLETEEKEPVKKENDLVCPPNGVIDLGPCKFGAPLFVSWPLFYLGDKSLSEAIDGLEQPNEDDHGFRMDLQPTMGLGISVHVRMQINLKIESSEVISGLPSSLKDSSFLLPIMWFDDAIEEPPKNLLDMLLIALKTGPGLSFKVMVIFLILCIIELVILFGYFIWKYSSSKEQEKKPWLKTLISNIGLIRQGGGGSI